MSIFRDSFVKKSPFLLVSVEGWWFWFWCLFWWGDDDGGGVAADGFGGYPWVGMVTRNGALTQNSGLTQTKITGTTPTFSGGTSLSDASSGESSIQNRYSVPVNFGSLIPATYRDTSFTIVEKFCRSSTNW